MLCCHNTTPSPQNNLCPERWNVYITVSMVKANSIVPSPALFSLCCSLERIVSSSVEQLCSGLNVACNLRQCIFTSVDVYSFDIDCACTDHRRQQLDYFVTLYTRLRIHHFVRIRNRELKQLSQSAKLKRNRKAKKVTHSQGIADRCMLLAHLCCVVLILCYVWHFVSSILSILC